MSLVIEKYNRKPFTVEAVQVTVDNMAEVAEWCGGEVIVEQNDGRLSQYIYVPVNKAISERQKKAYGHDWILKGRGGFKCYSRKAFIACFEKRTPVLTDLKVHEISVNEQNLWPDQEPLFEPPKQYVNTIHEQ